MRRLLAVLTWRLFQFLIDYPRRDQWERPLIKLPGEKKERAFTRASTVGKALDNMDGLFRWSGRMVAGGAALRQDIVLKIASLWPPTDETKAEIDRCVNDLKEAASASAGAITGDALHGLSARLDRGEAVRGFPPFDKDLAAYRKTMDDAGIEIFPEWIERTIVIPSLNIAGSFDRIIGKAGQNVIADLKTGQELYWGGIAVQLALYAHGELLYDWDADTFEPMPPVNQKQALVIWLPAGKATCSLYVVDIEAGWEAAQQALWVRAWRTRKDLARKARTNGRK